MTDILELIKIELDMDPSDTSKDKYLSTKVDECVKKIMYYLKCEEEEALGYVHAIKIYCAQAYRNKGTENILSRTQGKRSETFIRGSRQTILPYEVKALLPDPPLKWR